MSICIVCSPNYIGSNEGLCLAHEDEFEQILINIGCDISSVNILTQGITDEEIGIGPCMICGKMCDAESFCYGCAKFVCGKCVDTEVIVAGKHESQAHIDAIDIKMN